MKIILLAAASLLLPVAMVTSQYLQLSATSHGGFDAADRDADGKLSRTEASDAPALSVSFDTADVNADGVLEPLEYLQARRAVSSGNAAVTGIHY